MSTENQTVETATEQIVETDLSSRLQQSAFAPETVEATTQAATAATEQATTTVETKVEEAAQVVEPFYKSLGFEKEEDVINEIKTLREKKPEPLQFADDETRRLYEAVYDKTKRKEVRQILEAHEQIEELSAVQVDKDNAADIIKLQLKLKNKQLSKEEVEFEYKQNFVAPKEPVQKATEDDDDFKERMDEWNEKVAIVEQKRIIAAKLAQPELGNLKSELPLPEIKRTEFTQAQPTEEDIRKHKATVDTFLVTVDSSFNDFKGFNTQVKDKDVDFPVSYEISGEEKNVIKSDLQHFAESNFDANSLFVSRWTTKQADGSLTTNTAQMVKDLSAMYSMDNVAKKIATDAANKRMEEHWRLKKNIDLGISTGNNTPLNLNNQETISQKLQEAAFGGN